MDITIPDEFKFYILQCRERWKVIWGSPRDLGGSPSVGGQRWIPGGWEVNGGSRAVVGPPGVPEFCEGSSTGPGGFAGHLGVRASEHTLVRVLERDGRA